MASTSAPPATSGATRTAWLGSPSSAALLFVAYVLGAELGDWLSADPGHFATFWPNSGLYLAVLLRTPLRRWGLMIAAAVAANLASDILAHGRPIAAIGFAFANTIEAMTGAALLRLWFGRRVRLDSLVNVLRMFAVIAFVSTPLGALVGAATVASAFDASFMQTWRLWWVADALGVLLVAPLVLAALDFRGWSSRPRLLEMGAVLAVLVGGGILVFTAHPPVAPSLLLLVLLWAAVRLGINGVALGMFVLAVVAVRCTVLGFGLFAEIAEPLEQAVAVQTFLAVAAALFYSFAIVLEERRRAEASLEARVRERTEELRFHLDLTESITDNATTAIFLMDRQGRCTFMNPAAEALTGFTFAELRGCVLHDAIHHHRADGRPYPLAECPIDRALPEHFDVVEHEDTFIRKDGTYFPVRVNAKAIRDEGEAIGTVIEVRDVTREKAAEAVLREKEALFRSMADNAPVMLWVTDPEGDATYLSRRWYEYTGRPEGGDVGLRWLEAVHPDDARVARDVFLDATRRRVPFTLDYRLRRSDGEWRWAVDAGLPRTVGGEFVGFVGCVLDVHERKELEDEQRRLAADLREEHRRKDEFLATLAHELRNPLAPLRSALELMRASPDDPAAAGHSRAVMERQLSQLVRLVDDLLDVSRVMGGKVRLRRAPATLAAVLDAAIETSRPHLDECGHELVVTLPDEPVVLEADQTRLAQAFTNLLNNAAKYSDPRSRIWLKAERRGEEVAVTVRDSGVGISAEQLPRLFEMFSQEGRALDRSRGGLGIGLALVRSLVEMHGGRIEAHSDGPGRGAAFAVHLPVLAAGPTPAPQPREQQPAGAPARRILVVDDNRDGADSLAMMLRVLGHDTRTAYDGVQAIEAAEKYRPEVLLLDIGLPRMNGYEVCRHLREQAWGEGMLIVAVTGWGQEDDRRRSREAGFDHHLVKPVDPDRLLALLANPRDVAAAPG